MSNQTEKAPKYLVFADDPYMLDYEMGNLEGDKEQFEEKGFTLKSISYINSDNLPVYFEQFKEDRPQKWETYVYDKSAEKYYPLSNIDESEIVSAKNSAIQTVLKYLGAKEVEVIDKSEISNIESERTKTGGEGKGGGYGVGANCNSNKETSIARKHISELSFTGGSGKRAELSKIKEVTIRRGLDREAFFRDRIRELEDLGNLEGEYILKFTYYGEYNNAMDIALGMKISTPAFLLSANYENSKEYKKIEDKEFSLRVRF